MTTRRPSHAIVTTATVAVVALLGATIALAAASTASPLNSPSPVASAIAMIKDLAPPPGAAMLLIAGLIAARRAHR